MTLQTDDYFYNKQLKRYILQFMAIFQGLQVSVGKNEEFEERLIPVNIHYGDMDRVFAAIVANNVQTSMLRLPMMTARMTGISQAPQRQHGVGMERRTSYVPVGGLLPDDIQVVYQRAPTPYDATFELSILTSNSEQHFQILEQIMPLFDPQMTIQTSDALFDMSKIIDVKMDSGPTFDTPMQDTSRRLVSSYINFTVGIYIDTPTAIRQNYIKKILIRIGELDSDTNIDTISSVADELDALGLEYTQVNTEQESI